MCIYCVRGSRREVENDQHCNDESTVDVKLFDFACILT